MNIVDYASANTKINKYSTINKTTIIISVAWIGVFLIYAFIFILSVLASTEGGGWSFDSALKEVIHMYAIVLIYPVSRGFFYYSLFKLKNAAKTCVVAELQIQAKKQYERARIRAFVTAFLDVVFIPLCIFIVSLGLSYLNLRKH